MTEEQWARLDRLLPVPTRSGRRSELTRRQLIDGIRRRVRVGAPGRGAHAPPRCHRRNCAYTARQEP
ncbi:hypothetical protein [Streptomyces sp. NPDC058335]|uniref:hypothetical protein n=1 Tax=Streptomyces sp. NPDC058335 TaxID=3346451 RepID=UPI00366563BF